MVLVLVLGKVWIFLTQEYIPFSSTTSGARVHHPNSSLWSNLWSLKVPPNVKSFLWRASSRCLPTRVQLFLKGMQIDSRCPLCGAAPESILHIFVRCDFAKACSNQASFHRLDGTVVSFGSWLEQFFLASSCEDRVRFAMIM